MSTCTCTCVGISAPLRCPLRIPSLIFFVWSASDRQVGTPVDLKTYSTQSASSAALGDLLFSHHGVHLLLGCKRAICTVPAFSAAMLWACTSTTLVSLTLFNPHASRLTVSEFRMFRAINKISRSE